VRVYHFSGIDRVAFLDLLAREGAAGMVNALIAEQPAMLASYLRWPEIPLVGDSAAFQGNQDLEGYASLVKRLAARFLWWANLDVIGNQEASDRNWAALAERGAKTLWIYQVRGGRDLDYMQGMAATQGLIGIGGLVPVLKQDARGAMDLIGSIGERLALVNARAHFFGLASPAVLAAFASAPWFASADSQAWLCGFKVRELITRDGRRVKADKLGLSLTKEECAGQNIRQFHGWLNGQPLQLAML